MTLFVGHLVETNHQSTTVKSYISAIRAVLREVKVNLMEDQYLITALTKTCHLKNDTIYIRLPIQKVMLIELMDKTNEMK